MTLRELRKVTKMKITEDQVAECLKKLRNALPQTKGPSAEEMAEIWHDVLRNRATPEDLAGGIRFLLSDWKTGFWPPPGKVLEYVEKYRTWRDAKDLEKFANDCRDCGGQGFVRGAYTGDKYDGRDCYTPCSCPVGKQKSRSLNLDEKAGRAHKPKEARRYVPARSKELADIEQDLFGRPATDRMIAMTPKIRAALAKASGTRRKDPIGKASVEQAKDVLARALPLDDDEVPF